MDYKNKTVIVTGGSRGIGKAVALAFGAKGANVVVNYTASETKAVETVEEIKALGGDAIAVKCNVAVAEDVEGLLEATKEAFGNVDYLINNAGITRDGLLIRMKEDDWDAVIDTNLKGVYLCSKIIGKAMLKQKCGSIVNMTSVVGVMGNAGQANYAASKAGVIGFTKSTAKEFASRGITVNAVAPGFINSDMTNVLDEEVKETYSKAIPLQKMGEPEDVANAVMFLCSDMAKYITGQVIQVDGGMLM
ncbi:MAG: 3-oxoacyl-[acyl-carrier-protein] reductase [Clostridia bacterium]|nr:3-oxoacyl-[acyl-carrier-protein] reductase [Clostridia bacterium]